jgi:uroporphyrinogen-III synthase
MARVLVTRPAAEAAESAALLREAGHVPIVAPLRIVEPLSEPWPFAWPFSRPAPQAGERPDAVIATSRNAFRGAPAPAGLQDLPVFCVGSRTAEAAAEAGFARIAAAAADAGALFAAIVEGLPPPATLLYAAGVPRRPELEAALNRAGYRIALTLRYRVRPAGELPEPARAALAAATCDAVLHFSAESARTYFALAGSAGLAEAAARPRQLCLSPAIAEAAARAARHRLEIAVAARPDAASLIACL